MSNSFRSHWLQHARLPCPSLSSSWSLLKLMSIESAISSFVIPFSCPQSFPASGSFPMTRLFASGGQSIGTSVSVLPMNIQVWFPLGLTGLISLLSKGLFKSLLQNLSSKGSILQQLVLDFSLWEVFQLLNQSLYLS